MSLEDWLLEGESIRFSVFEGYSKAEIVVTDKRLIFYKEGLAREEVEAYFLDKVAGYRVEFTRRIILVIAGVILAVIGGALSAAALTYTITLPIKELIFIPFILAIVGIGLAAVGVLAYSTLELIIEGRGKIAKPIKLRKTQVIQLVTAITGIP